MVYPYGAAGGDERPDAVAKIVAELEGALDPNCDMPPVAGAIVEMVGVALVGVIPEAPGWEVRPNMELGVPVG